MIGLKMYLVIASIFLVGLLTKLADLIADDGLKVRGVFSYIIGAVYGTLGAYILISDAYLAPVVIATIIAVVITKKIDKKPHSVAIAAMLLVLAVWGFPAVNLMLMAIFLAAGVIDEIGNDMADGKKINGRLKRIFDYRLVSDATALLVSLITGHWIIFLGMLAFTLGYAIVEAAECRLKK
jgi:hypothetical protein